MQFIDEMKHFQIIGQHKDERSTKMKNGHLFENIDNTRISNFRKRSDSLFCFFFIFHI